MSYQLLTHWAGPAERIADAGAAEAFLRSVADELCSGRAPQTTADWAALGVSVQRGSLVGAQGTATRRGSAGRVLLALWLNDPQARFVTAHEVAHLLLHADWRGERLCLGRADEEELCDLFAELVAGPKPAGLGDPR